MTARRLRTGKIVAEAKLSPARSVFVALNPDGSAEIALPNGWPGFTLRHICLPVDELRAVLTCGQAVIEESDRKGRT